MAIGRRVVTGFLITLACSSALLAQGRDRGRPGDERQAVRFGWMSSLAAGKEAARKDGRPLMVVVRCVP